MKPKSNNNVFVKFLVAFSIILNIFFISISAYLLIAFNNGSFDTAIVNYIVSDGKVVNFQAPGGCIYADKKLTESNPALKLDSKSRLLTEDGKVRCIVNLTPEEADAIQKNNDEQLNLSL